MTVPNTLQAIRTKVRKITARPSSAQITDAEIDSYINTFYLYDMPAHLKMESLRYQYQFNTQPNIPVYDLPTDLYLTSMPPVYIGGYQSYMTQSRENFFRINPKLNYLQQAATGNGTPGPYSFTLINTPITPGFKPNPPGAYSTTDFIAPRFINWNVLITAIDASNVSHNLVDDGQGHLFLDTDADSNPVNSRGTIDYLTGAVTINATGFGSAIPNPNAINAQYVPYVASRPQSVVFFQDQFILYPIPDQAYTVSFEAYKVPTALFDSDKAPQLNEWWQMLAYGAADKIFSDNADLESMMKFRPLLEEQMRLSLRRTIVQQTSERTASIYTEQSGFPQYPFGNVFSGF